MGAARDLFPEQFGFRAEKSIVDALMGFVDRAEASSVPGNIRLQKLL